MSDTRRSTRQRKTVNYSKLCDDESDDDFREESSAPQNKRKKNEISPVRDISKKATQADKVEKGRKSSQEEKQSKNKQLVQKPVVRISVAEKVLARDLQNAIQLSKQSAEISELSELVSSKISNASDMKNQVSRIKTNVSDKESEEEQEDNWTKSGDSSSSEEEEESDWSEGEKKPNKAKLIKTAKNKTKTMPVKAVTEVKIKKVSSLKTKEVPQTNKPSQKLLQGINNSSLKIPATGLRLGLSRKAFVKSLHPAVKVQQ